MMMNARSGIGISGDYMSSGTVLELQAARRSLADASVEGRFRDPLKITTTTVHQVSDKSVRIYGSLNVVSWSDSILMKTLDP